VVSISVVVVAGIVVAENTATTQSHTEYRINLQHRWTVVTVNGEAQMAFALLRAKNTNEKH